MDNKEKNNDSLSEMNNLFGTNITTKDKEETKDVPSVNNIEKPIEESNKEENIIKEEIKETQQEEQKEDIKPKDDNKEEKQEEEFKPINEPVIQEKEQKFINEEYVNKDENKPLVDKVPNHENKENNGLISELIDTCEHFDFKEVKINIALIGFAISLVGAVLYNLIITIPGVVLSYLAYKQALENKLTKQDKLLGVLGMALGICCVASLIITKISSLFY